MLLKTQIATLLIFCLFWAFVIIYERLFDYKSLSGALDFVSGMVVIYVAITTVCYYTLGLVVHRMFLSKKLFALKYSLVLSCTISAIFFVFFLIMEQTNRQAISSTLFFSFFIFASCLVTRYFTLKELRK